MEATLDVWEIRPESATRVGHPAPFPVELPARLIQLYTYEDDLVLDPFMGSGTTLVAAAAADRRGAGYDIDAGLCGAGQDPPRRPRSADLPTDPDLRLNGPMDRRPLYAAIASIVGYSVGPVLVQVSSASAPVFTFWRGWLTILATLAGSAALRRLSFRWPRGESGGHPF